MFTGNPIVDFIIFIGMIVALNVFVFSDSDIFSDPWQ